MLLHSTTKATQIHQQYFALCHMQLHRLCYNIVTIIDKEVTAVPFLLVLSLSFVIIAKLD